MSDLSMTVDVENIKKMNTFPNRDGMMSAEEVKAQFDKAPADIKKHINEVLVPAIDYAKDKAYSSVQFTEQALKKEEQEQARANISAAKNTAVLYEIQALDESQRAVARANIGAVDVAVVVTSVDGILPAHGNVHLCAVSYTEQELSSQERETARQNIGAVGADEHAALKETVHTVAQDLDRVAGVADEAVSTGTQALTPKQQAQARENIAAAPSGYGWGETKAATIPDNDANNALATGLYRATNTTVNVPALCNLIFTQAAFGGIIYQTAYCDSGVLMRLCDHDFWSEWKPIGESEKVYEHIATITVVPDTDGALPQHVIFTTDSNGNTFELTDFMIHAHAGFVDGAQSTLYMNVNNAGAIVNGAVGSISSSPRSFNIFFRSEDGGFKRVEYTSSMASNAVFNAQAAIEQSRLIPPMFAIAELPITKIDIFTSTGTNKQWVEGSTFELWGVRV